MSIILSTLLPLALSGSMPAVSPGAPSPHAAPIVTAARTAPAGAQLYLAQAPAPPAATPAAPAPAAIDKAAIIDKAAQAMTAVRTAQGKFSQIDDAGRQSAGAFYISRPGKVRFDYSSPEVMHIVSDGVSVSVEEPKRASYDSAPLASTPLHLFLRSNVDLKRDGSVVDVKAKDGSYFLTLEDKTGEAQGRMTLEFRISDFELIGWTTSDGAGAQTRVKLSDTQANVALKPSLFIVKDPADARDDRR
jgi:outer membrane lipoprotein-sorting protein